MDTAIVDGYFWDSPPLRRGTVPRKFWRYQHRIARLCRYKPRGMMAGMALGDAVIATMEHCEALGYRWDEDERGEPLWYRPDGQPVGFDTP